MSLFLSAFTFIFLAALPGRTTFLMLLMAARGRPRAVLVGAILAFAAQSAFSVALGNLLSFLPKWIIHLAAGLLFLYFAFHYWRESKRPLATPQNPESWRSAFSVIFAAEWGDVSQVAIASFSAQYVEKLTVLLSAVLALWSIAALAIYVGTHIGKNVKANHIQRFAALGFGVVGIYLILTSFR